MLFRSTSQLLYSFFVNLIVIMYAYQSIQMELVDVINFTKNFHSLSRVIDFLPWLPGYELQRIVLLSDPSLCFAKAFPQLENCLLVLSLFIVFASKRLKLAVQYCIFSIVSTRLVPFHPMIFTTLYYWHCSYKHFLCFYQQN